MSMVKGSHVLVHATVYTKHPLRLGEEITLCHIEKTDSLRYGQSRDFVKVIEKEPWAGIVVGRSVIISGVYFPGSNNEDPGDLVDRQYHKVIKVIPIHTQQWIEPCCCLEEDLEEQ